MLDGLESRDRQRQRQRQRSPPLMSSQGSRSGQRAGGCPCHHRSQSRSRSSADDAAGLGWEWSVLRESRRLCVSHQRRTGPSAASQMSHFESDGGDATGVRSKSHLSSESRSPPRRTKTRSHAKGGSRVSHSGVRVRSQSRRQTAVGRGVGV